MDGRRTWTDCDEAGDYVVPNVLSPRDLVSRPDIMDETVPHITICHLKINIFTAVIYRNILYGRVIVMHVETASSLFDMRGSRKYSRGGGGGHLQTRVGPFPYQLSRHKFIKVGRS